MSTDKHSVLLDSLQSQEKLGRFSATEDIGAKMQARNLLGSCDLDSRPPNSLEERLRGDPVGNSLLTDLGSSQSLGDAAGQFGLTSANRDGAQQRFNVRGDFGSNVRFVDFSHGRRSEYTSILVFVKENAGFTHNKDPCTVIPMRRVSTKAAVIVVAKEPKKRAKIGPDGKTIGQRIEEAMGDRGPEYRQADLLRDCNRMVGRPPELPYFVPQAILDQMRAGKNASSKYTTVIADALGVRGTWLQFGMGAKRNDNSLVESIVNLVNKSRTGS